MTPVTKLRICAAKIMKPEYWTLILFLDSYVTFTRLRYQIEPDRQLDFQGFAHGGNSARDAILTFGRLL
jgi:hypothetical protein